MQSLRDAVKERTWIGRDQSDPDPFVYLVRAPITPGHSQLIVPRISQEEEDWDVFKRASEVIETAMKLIKNGLCHALQDKKYDALRDFTKTPACSQCDEYVKLLILRASASEDLKSAFKIHLIPLFKSGFDSCQVRFRNRHGQQMANGGMLGWLGDAEDFVDQFEVDRKQVVDSLAKSFHLETLADALREVQ